jgi:septal ring factor EnvC (AmiA/AmiB activator)
MTRSTILMATTSAAAAMLSYTPTCAQWLEMGRAEGYVPEEAEPRAVVAAGLVVVAWAAGWLVMRLWSAMGRSGFEAVAVSTAVQERVLAMDGHDIVSRRLRRKEIDKHVGECDEETRELAKSQTELLKQIREDDEMIGLMRSEVAKAKSLLEKHQGDLDSYLDTAAERRQQQSESYARIVAISQAKVELLAERKGLA